MERVDPAAVIGPDQVLVKRTVSFIQVIVLYTVEAGAYVPLPVCAPTIPQAAVLAVVIGVT
jgi:ABC-type transporter lipoprotein component MlaA